MGCAPNRENAERVREEFVVNDAAATAKRDSVTLFGVRFVRLWCEAGS